MDLCPFTLGYLQILSDLAKKKQTTGGQIGWQPGVNGQQVRLHLVAHRAQQAVSALHKTCHLPALLSRGSVDRAPAEKKQIWPM